ncbi:PE-PGRS family protein [Mycobacterium tuberculosis]|nr:PE-PGRS family protein [Mycobacterium tuberculosis]
MIAAPEAIAAAATDLASIGSTIGAANAAAAANTTAVLAAGADQVSVAIAAAFGAHGQAYQALSAQAATFHIQFVQALTAGAGLGSRRVSVVPAAPGGCCSAWMG